MSEIVRTVTRWIAPFIVLYGLQLVAYGHLTPGGGFPGGVMLGSAYILFVIAWGRPRPERGRGLGVAKVLDATGALLFLAVAVAGIALGTGFFVNFIQKSRPGAPLDVLNAGTIPVSNAFLALKVAAGLFAVFVVLAAARFVKRGDALDYTGEEEE